MGANESLTGHYRYLELLDDLRPHFEGRKREKRRRIEEKVSSKSGRQDESIPLTQVLVISESHENEKLPKEESPFVPREVK